MRFIENIKNMYRPIRAWVRKKLGTERLGDLEDGIFSAAYDTDRSRYLIIKDDQKALSAQCCRCKNQMLKWVNYHTWHVRKSFHDAEHRIDPLLARCYERYRGRQRDDILTDPGFFSPLTPFTSEHSFSFAYYAI